MVNCRAVFEAYPRNDRKCLACRRQLVQVQVQKGALYLLSNISSKKWLIRLWRFVKWYHKWIGDSIKNDHELSRNRASRALKSPGGKKWFDSSTLFFLFYSWAVAPTPPAPTSSQVLNRKSILIIILMPSFHTFSTSTFFFSLFFD